MWARFGEGRVEEPALEGGEDGVPGGVEGVGVGWGRVSDGSDEERAEGHLAGYVFDGWGCSGSL